MSQGFTGSDKSSLLNHIVNGRLTLVSGDPAYSGNTTGATTVYFTPYKGNRISLYNTTTSKWELKTFSELSSGTVPPTTNTLYDVFVYDNSGVVTMSMVAWTNFTTRATALARTGGVLTLAGDASKRYVGTFMTDGFAGQVDDTSNKRLVWNYYNRVKRYLWGISSANHTYNTAAWRQWNNTASSQFDVVVGVNEDFIYMQMASARSDTGGNVVGHIGIGVDSTTVPAPSRYGRDNLSNANVSFQTIAELSHQPATSGYHYYSCLQYSGTAGTMSWNDLEMTGHVWG